MARPTQANAHVDRVLTNVAIGSVQEDENFVAGKIFPEIPSDQKTGEYFEFTTADFLRDEMQDRKSGVEAAEADFAQSTSTYTCKSKALRKFAADEMMDEADDRAMQERAIIKFLAVKRLIARDRLFAANFFSTSKWGTDATPATKWDVATGGSPLGDAATARKTVILATGGFHPNYALAGYNVHQALLNNPVIVNRVQYTVGPHLDIATAPVNDLAVRQAMAKLLQVKDYYVSEAVYDSANENAASAPAFALGDHMLIGYRAPGPSKFVPSGGYTFLNETFGPRGMEVRRYREEGKRGEYFEVGYSEDMKLTASAAGYLIYNCLT